MDRLCTMAAMSEPILFLDLATQMGWCEGVPGGKPASGTFRLGRSGAPTPIVLGGLVHWLGERLSSRRYAFVIFEATIGPSVGKGKIKTSYATTSRLERLAGVCEGLCAATGHDVFQATAQTIRKQVLGVGRPENPKAAVIAAMRQRGFSPKDDNEADAIAGWLYACADFEKKNPPLLRNARRAAG